MPTQELVFWQSIIQFGLVILLKGVVFWIGYLTVRLGYNLVREGVRGEFKFRAEWVGLKGGLASVSSGLLFVLLGVILIGYAIGVSKDFQTHYEPHRELTETPTNNPLLDLPVPKPLS